MERTVEASYYGSQLLYQFRSCSLSGTAGCVSIETLAGEGSLAATATDAHGLPVPVWVVDASHRQDVFGTGEVYGEFCGHTTTDIRFDPGAKLEFWVGGDWHPDWWIVPEGCLPPAATTGTIRVTFSEWTPAEWPPSPPEPSGSPAPSGSPEPSGSPAPQPAPTTQPETVARSVELRLQRHLRSAGTVTSDDPACRSQVLVVIERKKSDRWVKVGSTTTDPDGAFAFRLRDRVGRYRTVAPEIRLPERTCLSAVSPIARHRH